MDDFVSIEESFNQSLLDADQEDSNVEEAWDRLPRFFKSFESHPQETNILCWYCSLKFKGRPWFIINYCNNTPKGVVMDIEGNFCSCGCLMGFVAQRFDRIVDFDKKFNVHRLYKMWTNRSTSHIHIPKDRYALNMYGGDMSVDEYRKHIADVDALNHSTSHNACNGSI